MNKKQNEEKIKLIGKYSDPHVVNEENKHNFFTKLLNVFDLLDVRALWHIATHLDCAKRVFNIADISIIVSAVAYVIIPFDAIPDTIPIIGQLDDAGVINFILNRYNSKIKEYKQICMEK